MSKESYVRGFEKVARDHNVDPAELMKFAQSVTGYWQGPSTSAGLGSIGSAAARATKNVMSPAKSLGTAGKWLKKLTSVPSYSRPAGALAGRAAARAGQPYGGYGNAQAYEDAYRAFQE